MTTTKNLQKQLTDALKPLKDHPEVKSFLPYLEDEKNDIFLSFLPFEKTMANMSPEEKEQLKYYKAFWIINELIASDPTIIDDKNSGALRKVAISCYANAPQLHSLYGIPANKTGNHDLAPQSRHPK